MRLFHFVMIVTLSGAVCAHAADQSKKINPNDPDDPKIGQPMFERVFGDYARLDAAKIKMIVDEAKLNGLGKGEPPKGANVPSGAEERPKMKPAPAPIGGAPAQEGDGLIDRQGKRWYYDTNRDGRPDEVWFIDTQVRAPEAAKPILVRVIDEGGDLQWGGEPDQVNDLYIVDWHADGIVDTAIEYRDLNGDGGAEQQVLYWFGPTFRYYDGERMRAIVYTDLSGDHEFVHVHGYKYDQPEGQWRSSFGPDKSFHCFALDTRNNVWQNYWENPFGFYDRNRDGSPEEAIRFSGGGGMIDSYRHSFDAVNAAPGDGTERHYDCSISAVPRGGVWDSGKGRRGDSDLWFDPKYCETMKLRGIPTEPFVAWDKLPAIGRGVVWARALFVWTEDGNNSDPEDKDFNQRWEGVIAPRVLDPQQKKFEDDVKAGRIKPDETGPEPRGKNSKRQRTMPAFYSRDNAIFPNVGGPDCGAFNRRFEMILDPRRPVAMYYHPVDQRIHIADADKCWIDVDFDRDGKADMAYKMESDGRGVIDRWRIDVNGDGTFEETVTAARGFRPAFFPYQWADMNAHIKATLPAVPQKLYAIDLELEKALKRAGVADRDPLAALLENSMRGPNIPDKLARIYVNSDEGLRYWLDCLKDRRIAALRSRLKDLKFWRQFDGARSRGDLDAMLAALVGINGSPTPDPAKLYEAWTNKLRSAFQSQQVAYRYLDSRSRDNVMWENTTNGYRIYNGQFDLFGKYAPQLISRIKPDWGNYHHEQPWGMDCLLLGSTAGLGGVTLFVNGTPYPVRNGLVKRPGDIRFDSRISEFTSDTVTIEYTATGVGPKKSYTVAWRLTARGGRSESMNEITVSGGEPGDTLRLGLEMMKLPPKEKYLCDTDKGVMASRIFEGPEIGWVGLGLIFPPQRLINMTETASSHMAVVACEAGRPLTYATQFEWVFGRKYRFGPTAQDWFKEMQNLADRAAGDGRDGPSTAVSPTKPATEEAADTPLGADAVAAARGLVERILPRHAGQIECAWIAPEGGRDVYEIESRDGKVVLRGNNGVSLASALNEYLKYTAHCEISACGSQLNLPETLPPVAGKIRRVATVPRRLMYNYCTFGYAMAWWDWAQWERELDRLALAGFNLPLIVTGQEAVWINTFTQYGYSRDEIRHWLGSPAHFPWLFMQNMEDFGGELPEAWVEQRTELAQKIIGRAHELGMDVVLQGYYGMVPSGFARRHPQAKVIAQGLWCRTFKRPDMLDPSDPMYARIAATFMKEQEKLYGRAGFYAADPFHEGGVSKGVNLADCGRRVFDAMQAADPEAIWVKQCWQTDNAKMLSTIPPERVLALDLWAEARPFWPRGAFKGKSWVWCVLHNFGGNVGLNADLERLASAFPEALASPKKGRLAGLAMVPEGHGNTPVVYELVPEFIWKGEPADLKAWIPQYLARRYGADSASARAAWDGLLKTVYAVPYTKNEAPSNAVFQARPLRNEKARSWSTTKVLYDGAALVPAWEKLLEAAPECAASDGYRYDLADVTRQVLADLSRPLYERTQAAVKKKDLAAFDKNSRAFLELMTDLDGLLATRREFLLGPWLADARRWGATPETGDLHEWQARLLLTLWNNQPGSDLNDYANRQWSGLVRDYYRMRWQMYCNAQAAALKAGKPLDQEKFLAELADAEKAWTRATNVYPTEPAGDTVAVARRLREKYAPLLREVYAAR